MLRFSGSQAADLTSGPVKIGNPWHRGERQSIDRLGRRVGVKAETGKDMKPRKMNKQTGKDCISVCHARDKN
jgi:hypothetical protein